MPDIQIVKFIEPKSDIAERHYDTNPPLYKYDEGFEFRLALVTDDMQVKVEDRNIFPFLWNMINHNKMAQRWYL
jgi:hypothetical protein